MQLLVDQGHISQEAAGSHPQRNLVLQALTGEEVMEPAMTVREARAGDRFMLCSDGLTDVVGHAALAEALGKPSEPQESVDRLIALALEGRHARQRHGDRGGCAGEASFNLLQPAMQPLAQLVGVVLLLRAPLARHDRAGGGHAREPGETDELPGHPHRSA